MNSQQLAGNANRLPVGRYQAPRLPSRTRIVVKQRPNDFQDFARRQQRNIQNMDIVEKIQTKFVETVAFAKEQYQLLDRQYGIEDKLSQARSKAKRSWDQVDIQFGISNRAKLFGRRWPEYRRKVSEFLETPPGRVLIWGVFIYLIASGWIFYIISMGFNLLFLAFIFGPFVAPLLLRQQAQQIEEAQRAAQAQQQQYWQQQQGNPYGWGGAQQGPFGGAQQGPFAGAGPSPGQGWSNPGGSQRSTKSPDEIIIDVEATVEDKKRK